MPYGRGMHPDWLGSPQHAVGAALLAGVVAWFAPSILRSSFWVSVLVAVSVAMTAEVAWEIAEYPLRYADDPNLTAYYDTVADLTSSLVGGLLGAMLVAAISHRRREPAPDQS
jgi:hypothetical protein